jgi:hypothetical protein
MHILRTKEKKYLKAKINELETNSKNKNFRDLYRGINDFQMGYQPRTNIVKDEKGHLITDSHSILARWRNHFSQLLNVHGVNDVRQTEIQKGEPLVSEPSAFEVETAIEKLKRHKSPGTDQIPAELIKAGRRTIHSEIHKLINSICNKVEVPEQWKELITVPFIRRAIKQTAIIIEPYHFYKLHTKFYPTS